MSSTIYGQSPEFRSSIPIQKILDEEFIYSVLTASTVTVTRLDSGKSQTTIDDKNLINFIKDTFLDDQTYISGIKRSCPFIPSVIIQLKSSYRASGRMVKPYMVTLNYSSCPKMQIEYEGAKRFIELSEKGWKKMSALTDKLGYYSENNNDFRTQLLVFSSLLEKKDMDLIVTLYNDKFFQSIDHVTGTRSKIKCNIVLDGKNSVIFEQLLKQSLIRPIEAGITRGEVKLIKKASRSVR